MEVRAATEGEIDRLAAIWHQGWHEAHARIVPPDLTRIRTLDSFGDRLDSAIDRATIGIMTASLVIGSSIVMTVPGGPTIFGVSLLTVLGLLGYLTAFVNSVWVIFSIWRSSRR